MPEYAFALPQETPTMRETRKQMAWLEKEFNRATMLGWKYYTQPTSTVWVTAEVPVNTVKGTSGW